MLLRYVSLNKFTARYLDRVLDLDARMYVNRNLDYPGLRNSASAITIALLANLNGRRSLIPAESIATGTNPLESGVVLTHSRDVIVCSSLESNAGM
jgi:hypothetical protein